jgi:cell division protein ftsK|uniref:DNA TRANSLOCASE FTSK n=1 Tax=Myoviridae sp. ctNYa18 TaxID=2825090 RepID=A0A8S5PHI7_9CAUD|nr:MAG TPA: DNA TRANSLOCASE FTSK [Myoviridae sp. ctNYa18]
MCFLNNQIQFKKRYIAKVYDEPSSPALVVGKAMHKMIEERLKGQSIEVAIQSGLQEIENIADYEIDYGKTGSREKIIDQYQKLSTIVINELPTYDDILAIEDRVECELSIRNKKIPMKGYIDVVRDLGDALEIIDWKSVTSYSDEDTENWAYLIQSWIYVQLIEFKYKKPVSRVVFKEVKKSINRDGMPQIKDYVLDRHGIEEANDAIGRVVKAVSDYVDNPDATYFPNPRDMLNGAQSMHIVAQMEGVTVRTVHTTERREKFAPVNTVVAEDIADDSGSETERIMAKLVEFGVGGRIDEIVKSSAVDTYLLKPNRGVKMSKLASMGDDLSLALGSDAVRVIAPIYGTQTVGIEVPHEQSFPKFDGKANSHQMPIGVDTMNNVVYDDIAKMPHMLIGGQTGSGKSVFIRNIIQSLTNCQVDIIDMKGLDFEDLGKNIISEVSEALMLVKKLVHLMDERYKNKRVNAKRRVLIIDEYADLVMQTGKEKHEIGVFDENGKLKTKNTTIDTRKQLETDLTRILQKGRAANINVIIATQRPSADIVAPIIKANCPVKACLRVATAKNSEIILDESGGERLLGKGDMLYLGSGMVKPVRVQCFSPIEKGENK